MSREMRPFWQRLLLALTLVAFAQAGYVTQTHVHPLAVADRVAGTASHGKSPARDDPEHCPFCQEYLLTGAYLIPPPVILPLPIFAAMESFAPAREVSSTLRFSLGWRSRAPPHV